MRGVGRTLTVVLVTLASVAVLAPVREMARASGDRAVQPYPPGTIVCSAAVSHAPALRAARTAFVRLSGPPFGVAVTRDGRWSFVDSSGGVQVLSDTGFVPRAVRTIAVPGASGSGPEGNALTRDGRYLLAADGGNGATVLSVARAESGAKHAVLGTLTQPRHARGGGGGAIEVTTSPDGEYAFVSVESGDRVAVYDLRAALADGFHRSSYVGSVPLGQQVVGMSVSPNGRLLYVTSELAAGLPTSASGGTLSVISVAKAERDPARAVLATIAAGCSPVRVIVSADGRVVWVTARESNELLAFSAGKLLDDPAHALLASVPVGSLPVGLALVADGRQVVVADSNRFQTSAAHPSLTVVSVAAALANRPAILGTIRTGRFPREMALEPNGDTLLVSNAASEQLEAVAVGHLR
jgi:DNA-binding beta-propeller fold protein YncE